MKKEIDIEIINAVMYSFCESCNKKTGRNENDNCVGRGRIEDNYAYKYRYDGCKRKLRFVEYLEKI